MATTYISRTLLADKGRENQRLLSEDDLVGLQGPLIILGDPGLGKTRLTQALEITLGAVRTTGGTFYRNENPARFVIPEDSVLIIDGLDEITPSSGRSAVDEVLRKLSQIGMPRFILSCRAADWQGSADRHKIKADYGAEPTTLLLQPFSHSDAVEFLKSRDETIDAEEIVSTLEARDLGELCGNPLTLTLVGELAKDAQGLPENRSDLFTRACELLVREKNPAHHDSQAAKSTLNALLDSAGAIYAHLLLSGSLGVADGPRDDIPDGFISKADLLDIPGATEIGPVLKTRLFQSAGENLSIPFHRVIAEFLGARWLSKKMSADLSMRRVLQSLNVANGVPTALRGLHAWMAFFNDGVADQCIRNDPYGVLRYGEPAQLTIDRARLLLKSLAVLANEDPYFRSEDWGRRAVAGLARPELKVEIIDLIKRPDRHIHLSTLVLEALRGSALTDEIVPDLLNLVHDSKAVYAERLHAAEALIKSKNNIEWAATLETLNANNSSENKRLILDIISHDNGEHFTDDNIAEAILAYQNPFSDDEDEAHVSGMDYLLVKNLTSSRGAAVLDGIAERLAAVRRPRHSPIGNELSTTVHRLAAKALDGGISPNAARLWSWLRPLNGAQGYSTHDRDRVRIYLNEHETLRRDIQRLVFSSDDNADGAWMVIAHDLPRANSALAVSYDDTLIFVQEICAKGALSEADISLWTSLVRCQQSTTGFANELQGQVNLCTQKHEELRKQWDELTTPPSRDWRKENQQREERQRSKRIRMFEEQRARFMPVIEAIKSGAEFGALHTMANGYLNRYTDLDHDASPLGRLQEWLGDELARAAVTGFVAYLGQDDLPTAKQIAESHATGKSWNAEPVISCGILELVREKWPLTDLPKAVVNAAMATWWDFNDFYAEKHGKETQSQLEEAVFSSDAETEEFLATVIEPRIRNKNEHVPGLYRLSREERFLGVVGKLAIRWLKIYPEAHPTTQRELLEAAIVRGDHADLLALIENRLQDPHKLEPNVRGIWMAAAFLIDLDGHRKAVENFCDETRDNLWALRSVMQPDRSHQLRQISLDQYELVIRKFSRHWPPAAHPRFGWGDTNEWNGPEFIRTCINAIGADTSEGASVILDRLVENKDVASYLDQLKHVRAQQRKNRRDKEFKISSFSEVKQMLAGGLPASVDDLKTLILDTLDFVQNYIRNGDTDGWDAFWNGDAPKDENTCRDRIVDQMRPRLPAEIVILPETLMPESKRADIVAIHEGKGVPTEVKGQWHEELWDAAKVQLIQKYTRDWRADGRGIYIVLWCGDVPGKSIPKHPDGLARPTTPAQLCQMLMERLTESERSKIDVVVFDISKPKKPT